MDHPAQPPLPSPATAAERRAQDRAERHRISGRSPVPLSVWLTQPPAGCCPTCDSAEHACAQRLSLDLAAQLVAAYSRPGDVVYVPDVGNAHVLIAAVQAGRRVLAYAHNADQARSAHASVRAEAVEVASLAVLRRADPRALPAQAERIRARAALAVLAPHLPTAPGDLAAITDACVRAIKPGGTVAICSRQNSGLDLAGHLVAHGQAAGLVYLQHIAAIEATAIDGKDLVPLEAPPTGHSPDCTCQRPARTAGRHRLAHSDVIVLQRP